MAKPPVVVCSSHNVTPGWRWLEPALPEGRIDLRLFDCVPKNLLERKVQKPLVARYRAAYEAGVCARRESARLVVSHMPLMTGWTSLSLAAQRVHLPHLAFAFNFTHLPEGPRRKALAHAFRSVQRFVVPSTVERRLYAQHFDIPDTRIEVVLWGVRKPNPPLLPPVVPGDYVAAVGGEGRDYATLMAAMRQLPHIRLVAVVRPFSLEGVDVPSNVTVLVNVSKSEADNVIRHAKLMALPLRDAKVPCGHITLVSALHMRKALVVSDSEGVHDYLRHEDNALLCTPNDADALARSIERLWDDPQLRERLSDNGERFAQAHCTEEATVRYFESCLTQLGL